MFFKNQKPKQFHYRPLYYDERKERLEQIKARAEAEKNVSKNTNLQAGFLTERRNNSRLRRPTFEKKSNLRFLLILSLILGLFYFVAPEIFLIVFRFK